MTHRHIQDRVSITQDKCSLRVFLLIWFAVIALAVSFCLSSCKTTEGIKNDMIQQAQKYLDGIKGDFQDVPQTAEQPTPVPSPVVTPSPSSPDSIGTANEAINGFDDSKLRWKGGYHCSGPALGVLKSVSISGHNARFSYDKYSWPLNSDEGCDAVVCIFEKQADGTWVGGKFDWIRKGGQGVKTMENIYGGYGGLTVPLPDALVAFVWGRVDGKGRSDAVFTRWLR